MAFDGKAFAAEVIEAVTQFMSRQTDEIVRRLDALERAESAAPDHERRLADLESGQRRQAAEFDLLARQLQADLDRAVTSVRASLRDD